MALNNFQSPVAWLSSKVRGYFSGSSTSAQRGDKKEVEREECGERVFSSIMPKVLAEQSQPHTTGSNTRIGEDHRTTKAKTQTNDKTFFKHNESQAIDYLSNTLYYGLEDTISAEEYAWFRSRLKNCVKRRREKYETGLAMGNHSSRQRSVRFSNNVYHGEFMDEVSAPDALLVDRRYDGYGLLKGLNEEMTPRKYRSIQPDTQANNGQIRHGEITNKRPFSTVDSVDLSDYFGSIRKRRRYEQSNGSFTQGFGLIQGQSISNSMNSSKRLQLRKSETNQVAKRILDTLGKLSTPLPSKTKKDIAIPSWSVTNDAVPSTSLRASRSIGYGDMKNEEKSNGIYK